jgi:hypothetical protein
MPLSMAGIELFSWTLLVFWLLDRVMQRKTLGWRDLAVPGLPLILVYGVVMVMGAFRAEHFTADDRWNVVGEVRLIPLMLMYFDLFKRDILTPRQIFQPMLYSLIVVSVFGVYQFCTGSDPFRDVDYRPSFLMGDWSFWRVKGFYSTPMTFGNTMALWFAFLASLMFWPISWLQTWRFRLPLMTVLSGLAFLFSFVRGAWIGVFLTALLVTLIKKPKMFLVVLLSHLVLVAGAYWFVPPIQQRIDHTLSGEDTSIKDRLLIWKFYGELIQDYPLLGAGHRFTGKLMKQENIISTGEDHFVLQEHAHSNFLQILAGLGLVGFVGFYGFFLLLLRQAWAVIRRSSGRGEWSHLLLASVAALSCFHFSSLTEATILDWEVVHMYALFLGVTLYALQRTRQATGSLLNH